MYDNKHYGDAAKQAHQPIYASVCTPYEEAPV